MGCVREREKAERFLDHGRKAKTNFTVLQTLQFILPQNCIVLDLFSLKAHGYYVPFRKYSIYDWQWYDVIAMS